MNTPRIKTGQLRVSPPCKTLIIIVLINRHFLGARLAIPAFMFKNYFLTAWRSLVNNKGYSLLNITGLTIGLAVGLLILLWVNDELGFDRFHHKAGQIYRVNAKVGTGLSAGVYSVSPAPIATYALKEVPGVQNVVRMTESNEYTVFSYNDKVLEAGTMLFTDPSIFQIFDFKLLQGDVKNPFPNEQSVILTEKAARRYFGNMDPIGKTLMADNKTAFTVSGVMADLPQNSFLQCDMLFSTSLYKKRYNSNTYWKSLDEDWGNYAWSIYLQLQPGVSLQSVADKLTQINIRQEPTMKPVDIGTYQLQPLTQVHLYAPNGNATGMKTVQIFFIVAVLILLIACINYVNLSTARAILRSKEVSVRKIMGAGRIQLLGQFITETFFCFIIALLLAFGVMALLMPVYNQISGKEIQLHLLDADMWKVISITVLLTLAASSIYPALLLSSFQPLQALKGKLSPGVGNTTFRKVLVVCQFSFSVGLIIGTLIINRQLRFIYNKELGFNKTNVFSLPMRDMEGHHAAVKAELLRQPGIQKVTTANRSVAYVPGATLDIKWDGKDPNMSFFIHSIEVDEDFFSFFQLKMAAGHTFTGSKADSTHFILNEAAVKEAGIQNPVGKQLTFGGTTGTIIGIVKDFHFSSLREKIQPFIFQYQPDNNMLFVKTSGKNVASAVSAVEKLWKQYNPGFPLKYSFQDEVYDLIYKSDTRTGALFDIFTVIAIFISCLGLFGLVTYAAHARVKEIGIRKVLGASVANIIAMLSKDFLGLIMLSILIASPLAWWAMHTWLMDFAYRVNIPWWMFIVAGLSTFGITVLTVSFQSVRAALANPVKSLKEN
jgi:putative ABC transport system permease protein